MPSTFRSRLDAVDAFCQNLDDSLDASSTGMPRLDRAMGGGLYPRKLYGFQARMKVGKTTFMGSISYNLNKLGTKHLWVACEMGSVELESRHMARSMDMNGLSFIRNSGHVEMKKRISHYLVDSFVDNIVYMDAPSIGLNRLLAVIDDAVENHGIRGFIVDYLQLVNGSTAENRTEHVEYVAQGLSAKVREHSIWGIVAAQVNQQGNTRNGEGLKLAGDQIYTLHREIDDPFGWLEMEGSRYTPYVNVGSATQPGFELMSNGPFFDELPL